MRMLFHGDKDSVWQYDDRKIIVLQCSEAYGPYPFGRIACQAYIAIKDAKEEKEPPSPIGVNGEKAMARGRTGSEVPIQETFGKQVLCPIASVGALQTLRRMAVF